jgi:hypothetical protein
MAGAGAVVPVGDVPALAGAIAARLAHPVLADCEGLLGRRRADDLFGADRAADRIATLVEKLVGARATERSQSGPTSARRRAGAEHERREDGDSAQPRERPDNTAGAAG